MAVGFAGLGLRKKGKEGCDILQSSQEQKDSCKTNAYWHENMLEWDMAAQKKNEQMTSFQGAMVVKNNCHGPTQGARAEVDPIHF